MTTFNPRSSVSGSKRRKLLSSSPRVVPLDETAPPVSIFSLSPPRRREADSSTTATSSRRITVLPPAPLADNEEPNGLSGSIELTKRDVDRLEPGIWLNDNLIDWDMERIVRAYKGEKRIHWFASGYYRSIPELRRHWRKIRHPEWDRDVIFMPINISNVHWILGVILRHADGHRIVICDPQNNNRDEIAARLTQWLEFQTGTRVSCIQAKVPQQPNDYDCGLFVLTMVEHFLKKARHMIEVFLGDGKDAKWFKPKVAVERRKALRKLVANK